ncbi:glutamate-5-semialdehyde dehydrogenase [Butyrivibrio sp. ob235]|uniref:glutamate-5-semialdehyde dehydrogenase n=1 Tax=Butyrivibrio sp. ob235 TaxID=1761780 RepID=UPI0008B9AB9B|nr:glutamate-5-semialdehyde dehydrogenase [Butyrivibrio sp. ob235]SEK38378.1 glutamate-5-semialdehyde dehydrogenase [Butyrivibrio sp. ob235]
MSIQKDNISETIKTMGQKAHSAKFELQNLTESEKNEVLLSVAKALTDSTEDILKANGIDIKNGEEKGMHQGLLDRLRLTESRIEDMAEGIRQVAELPDPIGNVIDSWELENGLKIKKVSVPLGVIGIIYESRPNVTADAFSLTFKAGNAVILKGGSDAINSNMVITDIIRKAIEAKGYNPDFIQLIPFTDRTAVGEMLSLREYIDVVIPRGSAGLIKMVCENSKIPVIETGSGNCHIYIDKTADIDKAIPIIINAKTQRIGVCNAAESLVVHEDIKNDLLPRLNAAMQEHNVELRADDASIQLLPGAKKATEEDFATEYLDYILSVKTVKSTKEAIEHINKYNTGHSESIITEDKESAELFLNGVDAACVYVNASTRFTDGFQFGFGAEIGISTQKLHARGPMGLKELTSYKYAITGDGQIRE